MHVNADMLGTPSNPPLLTLRGIKTVLIEREDFASGTSSKSTKLVHGGVRYLEKAVFQLDLSQLKLVYEALHVSSRQGACGPHAAQGLPCPATILHPSPI